MRERLGGVGAVLVLVLGAAADVRAEPPEPGTWRAGATATTVNVERWDPACGDAPKSSRAEGDGTVVLRREGSGIVIDARGREIRTGACWSRNPSIRRVATQAGGGVWSTQCKTPEGDPHEEHGTYKLALLSSNELLYSDESRFHWKLGDAVCAATTKTTQTLVRETAVTAQAEAEAVEPTQAPADAPDACEPGPAAKVTVRPAQASIELGERACFRVSASDAAGCAVPKGQVRWALEHDEGIVGRLDGHCFVAGERAAEAEGSFRVVATIGEARGSATVQVQAADLSSLLAKRVEETEVAEAPTAAPTPAAPAPPKPAAQVDSSARARSEAETDRWLAIASAGGFVLVLLVWLGLVRSRRRKEDAEAEADAQTPEPMTLSIAPSGATADNWICPTCRVGYPQSVANCPKDGSALVPWREFAESRRPAPLERGKRCPECGKRYEAAAAFCTDDGAGLVPTE